MRDEPHCYADRHARKDPDARHVRGSPQRHSGRRAGELGRRSRAALEQLKKAGGDAEMMHLPALGIRGNSLMLMQDRNSDQLADLVIAWIDKHVERKAGRRPRGTTR